MMRVDRERLGLSVARASWLLRVSVRRNRELEDGERYPDYETWDRCARCTGGRWRDSRNVGSRPFAGFHRTTRTVPNGWFTRPKG